MNMRIDDGPIGDMPVYLELFRQEGIRVTFYDGLSVGVAGVPDGWRPTPRELAALKTLDLVLRGIHGKPV